MAKGRRSCCSTGTWATGECGGPRSMSCRTSSPSWPGTHRASAARRIRPSTLPCRTSPTALPRSSTHSTLGRPHVLGLSFGGGLALELFSRHPTLPLTLVLASAYAGWAGSLPAEVADERVRQALRLADLPPDRLVEELLPSMFTDSAPAELVEEFATSMREFHPAGLRASSRAFAVADLRDVLARVDVPTLLLYGDRDMRAPSNVAHELHAGIPGSKLVLYPRSGSRVQHRRPGALQQRGARLPSVRPGRLAACVARSDDRRLLDRAAGVDRPREAHELSVRPRQRRG